MGESLFDKIRGGLKKTRENISGMVGGVLSAFARVDEELLEELEETLILCDIGVKATQQIMDALRVRIKEQAITNPEDVKTQLVEIIAGLLDVPAEPVQFPCAMLIVGVNGVGKTTTIGKLARRYIADGRSVLLAAADTFRAAAAEQLEQWGERAGVKVIRYGEGADPAAVVYDAVDSARHKNIDVLICDTAGRLHNKKNLMAELEKMNRVIDKSYPEAQKKTYLVVDATTGQNAVAQAREFAQVTDLSGVILTKLDGTAKGGIVAAIAAELNLPVEYIGVGESADDLQPFDARAFAQSLIE